MRRDAVVVLHFHDWSDTRRCVASVLAGSPGTTVVLVDNDPAAGPPEQLPDEWADVVVVRNERNLGFAGGMNVGISTALGLGADTVTVLNNDTVVPGGTLRRLGDVAATGVAVSPEVRYLDRPEAVWFGGGAVEPSTNLPHHVSTPDLPPPDDDGLRSTDVLAGCCVTATSDTWDRVGLFDERYFLDFEDSDWSMRARAAGVRLVVDTTVTIQHAVSASFSGGASYLGLYYYARNGLLFGREHGRRWLPAGLRFLRRHVLPSVLDPGRRQGDWRQTGRRALVLAVALVDSGRGRYGRAPGVVERLVARWAPR